METKGAVDFYWKKDGALRAHICKQCWRTRYYEPRRAELIERNIDAKRQRFDRPGQRTVACSHCGEPFTSDRKKALFCSRACKQRHYNDQAIAECLAVKAPKPCQRCGVVFQPRRSDAQFCSESCLSKAHSQTRKFYRRRGEEKQKGTPLISLAHFGERDGWRCQLCKKKIDKTKVHPDPLAPSIDHVVPLARGGTNDPANLQLVHLRCNLAKRDRPRGEQLRLIG